jgi:hypothetical protein
MRKGVISFVDGGYRYELAKQRQRQSMEKENWKCYSTFEEIGCKPHSEVPYQFKPYSIDKARETFDKVMWMDSAVYAIKDLKPLWDEIEKRGVVLFNNMGFTIGDFTNDTCLEIMKMSRDEAHKLPMIMACVMGFDFTNPLAVEFLKEYKGYSEMGAFNGGWDNKYGDESSDPRCKGHRHDQSVASIIAHRMGIELLEPHETFLAYLGNPAHEPIRDSVCLLTQGY